MDTRNKTYLAADLKRFFDDNLFWCPSGLKDGDVWCDDVGLSVSGAPAVDDVNLDDLADSDTVEIVSGYVVMASRVALPKDHPLFGNLDDSLETIFRDWLARQSTERLVIQIDAGSIKREDLQTELSKIHPSIRLV